MSLLSMASVTFGDAVGESNKTLLMRLCRSDGMLLKADRPATAMDAQFQAMVFKAWPGQSRPPTPPPNSGSHGKLVPAKCSAADQMQHFEPCDRREPCALRLAGPAKDRGCVDLGGCKTAAGSAISLYNNTLGACGTASTCRGKNEQWEFSDGAIKSVLDKTSCIKVGQNGATLAKCDAADKEQGWIIHPAGASAFALTSKADPGAVCLTAVNPPAPDTGAAVVATPLRGAFSWDADRAEEVAATDALFPVADGLSEGYRHAYATSATLMDRLEAGRVEARRLQEEATAAGEQCDAGYGAPQGPLGEVYSTHTSLAVTGGGVMTWRYVVGVQVKMPMICLPR